jgi:hypothetical protein
VILGVAAPEKVSAEPMILFDDPKLSRGLIAYDGHGGPPSGSSILLESIEGFATLIHPGVMLSCLACVLSFRTLPAIGIDRGAALASGHLTSIHLAWLPGEDLGVFSAFGLAVIGGGGALSGVVSNADFMNILVPVTPAKLVSSPIALLLMAAGWLGGALARLILIWTRSRATDHGLA